MMLVLRLVLLFNRWLDADGVGCGISNLFGGLTWMSLLFTVRLILTLRGRLLVFRYRDGHSWI